MRLREFPETTSHGSNKADKLEAMINLLLHASTVTAEDLGLHCHRADACVIVTIGRTTARFSLSEPDWELEWQELVGTFRLGTVRAQLGQMALSRDTQVLGPWSIYSTSFTADWLAWVAGITEPATWLSHLKRVLDAAENDGAVIIMSPEGAQRSRLTGHLRSRKLIARIEVPGAWYDGRTSELHAKSRTPLTMASAMKGQALNEFVSFPPSRERNYVLNDVRVTDEETILTLNEAWEPLTERRQPSGLPSVPTVAHPLPWDLTEAQCERFDTLENEGLRLFC